MARAVTPIRFDDDELRLIDRSATRLGMTRSAYVRQAVLASASETVATQKARAEKTCRHGLADCRICRAGRWA